MSYHYVKGRDGKKHRVYDTLTGRGKYASKSYMTLHGRGGYYDSGFVKSMNKYVPKGSMAKIGGIWGPLGGAAGHLLSKLAGFGEYKVNKNTLSEGQSPANMHSGNNKVVIRHREYITDIVSDSSANTFTNQNFPINPGLITSFPWLAPIAQQFEEYRVLGMVYEFKTLSADAIASSQGNMTIGGVIMATDYNSINPPFVNKQQMDNTQYTVSTKPSCSLYHPIECAPGSQPLTSYYIRGGSQPAGTDLRMYDLGQFQIASFGIASTSVILGELWCSYEIELSKPISTTALSQDVLSDHYFLSGTVSNSHVFATSQVLQAGSTIGGTITGNNTYNWNPLIMEGNYLMVYVYQGSNAGACGSFYSTASNNVAFLNVWQNDFESAMTTSLTATDTAYNQFATFVFKITGPNASVTFALTGPPGGTQAGDLFVTEINSNIVTMFERRLQQKKDAGQLPSNVNINREIEELEKKLHQLKCASVPAATASPVVTKK